MSVILEQALKNSKCFRAVPRFRYGELDIVADEAENYLANPLVVQLEESGITYRVIINPVRLDTGGNSMSGECIDTDIIYDFRDGLGLVAGQYTDDSWGRETTVVVTCLGRLKELGEPPKREKWLTVYNA